MSVFEIFGRLFFVYNSHFYYNFFFRGQVNLKRSVVVAFGVIFFVNKIAEMSYLNICPLIQ